MDKLDHRENPRVGKTSKEKRWQETNKVVGKEGEKWASQRKKLGGPGKKEN